MPPKLTKEQWEFLASPLKQEEFDEALKRAKPNSAPRKDKWRAIVWQKVPELADKLWNKIKQWEANGIPPEDKQSILCMLKKEKNEVSTPADVRPISLMSSSYKIYTDLFAERLQRTFTGTIHTDQRSFIRNRNIMENVLEFKIWKFTSGNKKE